MTFSLIHRLATKSTRLGRLSTQLYGYHPFSSITVRHASNHCIIEKSRSISLLGCRNYIVRHQFPFARFFSMAKPATKNHRNEKVTRLNADITHDTVRLVSDEGHVILTRREALNRAKLLNLDLVEVDSKANPPVCKILNYNKERYEKDVRDKKLAKAKVETSVRNECKEVHFKGKIEQKDLQIKAETIQRLMEQGYRVKVVAKPIPKKNQPKDKVIELSDAELEELNQALLRLYNLVKDISIMESAPKIQQRSRMYLIIRHAKFGSMKNPTKKTSKISDDSEDDVEVEVRSPVVAGYSKPSVLIDSTKERVVENYNMGSSSEVNSESIQRQKNDSPTVVPALKPQSDFSNDMKNKVKVVTDDPISVPPPVHSNRYKKSDASGGGNVGRVVHSRPSFEGSQNRGQFGTQQQQSTPQNPIRRAKFPHQSQPDNAEKHGEFRSEHQNFTRRGPSITPPGNFGSKFTPFDEQQRNQMAKKMEEEKSETARHGRINNTDNGTFRR